jgi:hypothetical protein
MYIWVFREVSVFVTKLYKHIRFLPLAPRFDYAFDSQEKRFLERFQSKVLHMIVDAPWYVPNTVIRRDLQTRTVKEEICLYSSQYSARLSTHPNGLVVSPIEQPDNRRLLKHLPNDLPTRFLV